MYKFRTRMRPILGALSALLLLFTLSCTKSGSSIRDLYRFPGTKDIAVEVSINYQLAPGVGPAISLVGQNFLLNAFLLNGTTSEQVEISRVGGEMLTDLPVTLDATTLKFNALIRVPSSARPGANGYDFHFALVESGAALQGDASTIKNLDTLTSEVKPGTEAAANKVDLSLATKIAYDFLSEAGVSGMSADIVTAFNALSAVISERVLANENLAIQGKATDLSTYVKALKAVVKLDVVNSTTIQQTLFDQVSPLVKEGFVTNFDKTITGYYTEAKAILANVEAAEPGLFKELATIPALPPIITDAPSNVSFTDKDALQTLGGDITFTASKNSAGVLSYDIYFGGETVQTSKLALIGNVAASATPSFALPVGTQIPDGAVRIWVYPVKADGAFPVAGSMKFVNVIGIACLLGPDPCGEVPPTPGTGGGVVSGPAAPLTFTTLVTGYRTIELNWTTSSPSDAVGYLLVAKEGSAPLFTPTNGQEYLAGAIDNGRIVKYAGSALSFSDSGLTDGTYYYDVFAYNNDLVYSAAKSSSASITYNVWAWVSGESDPATPPVASRGSKGEFNASNNPGRRIDPYICARGDEFYLFGGYEFATGKLLNDLWVLRNGQWAWIGGSTLPDQRMVVQSGIGAGTLHANNSPGGSYRGECAVDGAKNVWIYSGYGFDTTNSPSSVALDTLWRFDADTGLWAFMAGHENCSSVNAVCYAFYPSEHQSTEDVYIPGYRVNFNLLFDFEDTLYLYGGEGYVKNNYVETMSDLWRFNTGDNAWAFVKGDSADSMLAVYGTTGTAAAANVPGGRVKASMTASDTSLLLFGGVGIDVNATNTTTSEGRLGDLWSFNVISNNWTHLAGEKTKNGYGAYGTKGVAAVANHPGARFNAALWATSNGQVFVFGGEGRGSSSTGLLNDMWRFSNGEWAWVRGANNPGGGYIKGASEEFGETFTPSSRKSLANSIDPDDDTLLLFGAGAIELTFAPASGSMMYDVWRFKPDTPACYFCLAPEH